MERWKLIPGYAPYQASNRGRIRRKEGEPLKPFPAGAGYLKVYAGGRTEYVHRLTALAWIGTIPPKWEVNHKNFIRTDCRPENLEIVTRAMNMSHQKAPIWYESQTRLPIFK